MAYSIGHISGCHLNPAVTRRACGPASASRRPTSCAYIVAQVIGAIVAAALIWCIASGKPGFILAPNGLAANGYGAMSPGGYAFHAAFVTEVVMTVGFLIVILGSTDTRSPSGFAPIAIGLALTLIHLISIPITNTSVNPARSTGPALFVGGEALHQLWLFWVAPILGGVIGGVVYRVMAGDQPAPADHRRAALTHQRAGGISRSG